MDPGWYMNDIPSRLHKTAYPLSFADGHTEAFKFLCRDTLVLGAAPRQPSGNIQRRNAQPGHNQPAQRRLDPVVMGIECQWSDG